MFKSFPVGILLLVTLIWTQSCSTNPATGRTQFTGLLPPEAEKNIGAQEHQKVVQQMGLYEDPNLQNYVQSVGKKIVPHTERPDVEYSFYVVDSDTVNAFAIPGGYIYVTRGLLALAKNEAELAAVLAHEIGHITGRHSAERYSRGMVTGLGTTLIGAAVDNPDVARAITLGSDLYLKSYSRDQENEADDLGIRYLHRAGFDPFAMGSFLQSLQRWGELQQQITGKSAPPAFFSTHPNTANRVGQARAIAANYPETQDRRVAQADYLEKIDGLAYGASVREGVVQGRTFYHPEIGFQFTVPRGFEVINKPSEVISRGPEGSVIIFDFGNGPQAAPPITYLLETWMQGEPVNNPEVINVNGLPAATAAFKGSVGRRPVIIRVVAIQWAQKRYARFQMAIPQGAPPELVRKYRKTTFSFARLRDSEVQNFKNKQIDIRTATHQDTVAGFAKRQPLENYSEAYFRILNSMQANEALEAGRKYKLVVR